MKSRFATLHVREQVQSIALLNYQQGAPVVCRANTLAALRPCMQTKRYDCELRLSTLANAGCGGGMTCGWLHVLSTQLCMSECGAVVQATTSTTTGGRRAVGGPTHQAVATPTSRTGAITMCTLVQQNQTAVDTAHRAALCICAFIRVLASCSPLAVRHVMSSCFV